MRTSDHKPEKNNRHKVLEALAEDVKDRRELNIAMDRPGLDTMDDKSWEDIDDRTTKRTA